MSSIRRRFLIGLAGLALAAQSAVAPAAGDKTPIRIAWQPDPNVPYYLASKKQYFEQAGLDAQYVKFLAAPAMFAALQSSSVDIADMGLGPAIIARSQGVDIKLIAIAVDVSGSNALVMNKDKKVSSPKDLKGLRIAAQRGTTPHVGLVRYLEQGGLKASDVQFVDLPAPNIIPAFRSGQIDGAWVWSPWQNMLRQQGGHRVTTNKDVGAMAPQLWAVRTEYLKTNPQGVQKFLSAIGTSLKQIDASRDLAEEQLVLNLNIDKAVAADVMKDSDFPTLQRQAAADYSLSPLAPDASKGLKQAIKQTSDFLLAQGIIKRAVDPDELVDPQPLKTFVSGAK